MPEVVDSHESHVLLENIFQTLQHLNNSPYPVLESPPQVRKRASVALILRIQPSYLHWPSSDIYKPSADDARNHIERFFSQEWVRRGHPEALFIRRSSRKGDRWNGHVALPGGNRDPEDEDDVATAVREAFEEVGVDLSCPSVISAGNLPQRVVTARWGSKPILVLCPYIFLLTEPKLPPMRLQPTEVSSAHWVPIRMLLSPNTRTYEFQSVGGNENPGGPIRKWFGRNLLGSMLFAAIRLVPAESMYANVTPNSVLPTSRVTGSALAKAANSTRSWLTGGGEPNLDNDRPLKLWGLTLGVISDFLELLPPHDALELWTYPTFSPPDLRLVIWILSYRFQQRERMTVITNERESLTESEGGYTDTPPEWLTAKWRKIRRFPGAIASGLGSIAYYNGLKRSTSTDAVMLVAYYEILQKAIVFTMIGRSGLLIAFIVVLWRRIRRMATK